MQLDVGNTLHGICHLFRAAAKRCRTVAHARSLPFRLREFYIMWLHLRNILALEQIHFTDANPSPDL